MSVTVNAFTTADSNCDAVVGLLITQYVSGGNATDLCKYLLGKSVLSYGILSNQIAYGGALQTANTASGSLASGSFGFAV